MFASHLRRAALLAGASSLAVAASAAASCSSTNELRRIPTDAPARLRRKSSLDGVQPYAAGQRVSIVRVPQILAGVDVGHIAILVANSDGSLASVGFYSSNYRRGLPMVTREAGVLVSPDPVYMKAINGGKKAEELFRGQLTEAQARALNERVDDAAGVLAVTRFTTSAGEDREVAVSSVEGETYAALFVMPGSENCATWVERMFPGAIACPLGIPRMCYSVDQKAV